jgi:Asp-tRNA(Asn)/Glu-tRNA(Gln) amidotransferase A subunit family amidase
MSKLHDLGVAEAAKAIRTGEIKAEALADALLARAAAHKSLNAFIALDADKVRAAAREADRAGRRALRSVRCMGCRWR